MRPRKKGDTGYPITATLSANGVPVDLTGGTVAITLRNQMTQVVKVSLSACTITSPTTGEVAYWPISTDVDTPGFYDVEFRHIRADSSPVHFPSSGYEPLAIEDTLA